MRMSFASNVQWRIKILSQFKSFSQQPLMKKKPMSQQDLCYHFAIKTKKLAAKNRPDLAYGMISHALASASLTQPNTELFNTLISACAKQGELTLACDAYKMMNSRHVQPDSLTYLSLMNAYATAGNTLKKAIMEPLSEAKRVHFMTRMLALFEEAQSKELLTTAIFNVLLKGISWIGTLDHLSLVFPLTSSDPLPVIPDCISYTIAISCVSYCDGGSGSSFLLAEEYFAQMKRNLFNDDSTKIPKEVILSMLICYKMSIIAETKSSGRIFRKARDFINFYGKFLTDSKVLDTFLNICKVSKEYKYGLEVYEKLVSKNLIVIDESLETTYLSLLVGCKQFDKAINQFYLIKRPSRLTINAMLQGCRMEQKLDESMKIFLLFEQTPNLIPNIHSCEHAILTQIDTSLMKENGQLEKRIENLKTILKLIMKKESKLFSFFSHASLLTKLELFCNNSGDFELVELVTKIKSQNG